MDELIDTVRQWLDSEIAATEREAARLESLQARGFGQEEVLAPIDTAASSSLSVILSLSFSEA